MECCSKSTASSSVVVLQHLTEEESLMDMNAVQRDMRAISH